MIVLLRRYIAFIICLIAILLPWRLRIIYSEAIGWVGQLLFFVYISIIRFILNEVKVKK